MRNVALSVLCFISINVCFISCNVFPPNLFIILVCQFKLNYNDKCCFSKKFIFYLYFILSNEYIFIAIITPVWKKILYVNNITELFLL